MWLRPWHVIVCAAVLSAGLIGSAYAAGGEGKEVLLGLGLNLFSSIVFFVLLELYWERTKLVGGKEVGGFDYRTFARNVGRSRRVRVLGTFIYPLTDRPDYADERKALLDALASAVRRPGFEGVEVLFLHPGSVAARMRADERRNEDVIGRIEETLATLSAFQKRLDGTPGRDRVEVRLFSRTPPFALFQTDNFASISFYYRDRPISEVARYEFFTDTPIGSFVERTFDDLWQDKRTVRLEEYCRESAKAEPPAGGPGDTPGG
jgi:hypothetical protein